MNISDNAPRLEVNQRLSLASYCRIAQNLLRQASVYRGEGNIVELYIILLRFTSLVTETIPQHHEYRSCADKTLKSVLRKKTLDAITELEILKADALAEWERIQAAPAPVHEDGVLCIYDQASDRSKLSLDRLRLKDENVSLDILRPKDETVVRHSYFATQPSKTRSGTHGNLTKVNYPSSVQVSLVDIPSLDQKPSGSISPTKNIGNWQEPPRTAFPDVSVLPQYDLVRQLAPPPMPVPVQTMRADFPPQQSRPSTVADPRPGLPGLSESGPKHLHISRRMMDEFLAMARLNTQKNLETCGVLAGKLEKNVFSVTTLIVPKQEATSDSCQTVNEEELFEVQDERNLFQLGWIHTHPSQTCFMSSIDLHTHYSYQIMLREAIAIVMAPTDEQTPLGIFRLSEPGGVKTIQQCDQRGFHPHDEPSEGGSIYDHCTHVYMNPSLRFDIVDLRK